MKAEAGFQNVASPSYGEWSNSSWAELESQMIGHFPIHPLTLSVKQVFALRYLAPLAEYQEVQYKYNQHLKSSTISASFFTVPPACNEL